MPDDLKAVKFLVDIPLRCPCFKRISSPRGTKFGTKKLENLHYHMVKTSGLHVTWA